MSKKTIQDLRTEAKKLGINTFQLSAKEIESQIAEKLSSKEGKIIVERQERRRKKRGQNLLGRSQATLNRPEYQRKGYHRHWINDKPGRLDAAEASDYDFVEDSNVQKIKHRVGRHNDGNDMYAYLMEKRQDWYDEDCNERLNIIDAREKRMSQGDVEGNPYQANEYIPEEGIKIGGHSSHDQ